MWSASKKIGLMAVSGDHVYARAFRTHRFGDMFAIVRPTVSYGRLAPWPGEYMLRHGLP
jgi:hypothetical protein